MTTPTTDQNNTEDVAQLRSHLLANNGISRLNILQPDDVEAVVKQFRKDGYVLVENVLAAEQIAMLAEGCQQVVDEVLALDAEGQGNRGAYRYSFGGSSLTRSQLHRPAWQMLLELATVQRLVGAIFGSQDYILRAASGDFCLPGALAYLLTLWLFPRAWPV